MLVCLEIESRLPNKIGLSWHRSIPVMSVLSVFGLSNLALVHVVTRCFLVFDGISLEICLSHHFTLCLCGP